MNHHFVCPNCKFQAFDNETETCTLCEYTTDGKCGALTGMIVLAALTTVASLLAWWVS